MLLLINKEKMMSQMAQLVKTRLRQVLSYRGMPPSEVGVVWDRNAFGRPSPNFQVSFPEAFPVQKEAVRECIKDVWAFYKEELADRLAGLSERRGD